MDHPLLVSRFESLGLLSSDTERFIERQRPTCDAPIQALTVHEFEDEELRGVRFFQPMNLCDVCVAQRREYLRFAAEAGHAIRIVDEAVG